MGYILGLLLFLWVATMAAFEQLEAPFKLVFNQCLVDLGFFFVIISFILPLKRQKLKKERK